MGNRCEGIYVQQVGGTALVLASFTESFEDYRASASGAPLTIEWTAPDTGMMRLRAQGMKRDLYYRMDTSLPAVPSRYSWPSDVLAAQRITKRDLGVLGWRRRLVGKTERDVYLPLRIAQRNAPVRASTYELVLYPTVALKEVYLTISQVNDSGRMIRKVRDGVPLRYGYYPAQRPVRIQLANLGAPGLYYVEIGAQLESGGSVAVAQWFSHAVAPVSR